MSDVTWHSLDIAKDALVSADFETVAEKVDMAISAAMETIANVLPTATASVLSDGLAVATGAMNALHVQARVNRQSSDYAAGRLASAIDVLAYAASATASEAAVAKARQQPYARILSWLAEGTLRNTDIAAKTGWDKAHVSRLLDELRVMEMVTSHRSGRVVFNALTPAGRVVVEEGVQSMRRVPILENNVNNFAASRSKYNLAEIVGPRDVQETTPPRILAGAG